MYATLGVHCTSEGLQVVVQQSTICPSGSRALRSQTWLRKIDARSCVEWLITDYIDAISCVDFAKPCLASQSSWARRANCGLLHYWLEPFNCWDGKIERLKAVVAVSTIERLQEVVQQSTIWPSGSGALRSQTWLRKIDARNCVDIFSYQTTRRNFLRRFCEAMSGFAKLLSP